VQANRRTHVLVPRGTHPAGPDVDTGDPHPVPSRAARDDRPVSSRVTVTVRATAPD